LQMQGRPPHVRLDVLRCWLQLREQRLRRHSALSS
jgi:hypothetical protein